MARYVALGVLLQMKLTALRGHTREYGFACCFEAFMSITDKKHHAVQTPVFQTGQKLTPVWFCLGQRYRTAQNLAFPCRIYTQGDQHGTINHPATVTNLLVAGIENNVGEAPQGVVHARQ